MFGAKKEAPCWSKALLELVGKLKSVKFNLAAHAKPGNQVRTVETVKSASRPHVVACKVLKKKAYANF